MEHIVGVTPLSGPSLLPPRNRTYSSSARLAGGQHDGIPLDTQCMRHGLDTHTTIHAPRFLCLMSPLCFPTMSNGLYMLQQLRGHHNTNGPRAPTKSQGPQARRAADARNLAAQHSQGRISKTTGISATSMFSATSHKRVV